MEHPRNKSDPVNTCVIPAISPAIYFAYLNVLIIIKKAFPKTTNCNLLATDDLQKVTLETLSINVKSTFLTQN